MRAPPPSVAVVPPAPAPAPPAALRVTRRSLYSAAVLGWVAFATAAGTGSLAVIRMLFPNVVFEPPMRFRTAPPAQFAPDTVDTTWKQSNAVWIVHTEGRIFALSTVCTHLGCTPNWLAGESKFKCPCHGSGYYMNGVNFEGPAPRPLERYRVEVDPADGYLWVDKSLSCRLETGACDDARFYVRAT